MKESNGLLPIQKCTEHCYGHVVASEFVFWI